MKTTGTAQRTPDPWWVDDDHCIASGSGDDYVTVAEVLTGKADENLIAAAPDLLAALEEHNELHFATLDLLKRVDGPESMNLRAALYELMDKRHAAIAAARGGVR